MPVPIWIGLDVGDRTSRFAAIDSQMQLVGEGEEETDPDRLALALQSLPDTPIREIAVEASSLSIHLSHRLRALGLPVAVYEARRASRYLKLRGNKTDRNDAKGLAEIAKLRLPSIPRVHVKSPETHQLRAKLLLRTKLTRQKVACEGMLRALIRLHGGRLKKSKSETAYRAAVMAEAAHLSACGQPDISKEVAALLDICMAHRRIVNLMDIELAERAAVNPVCSAFLAVPGIGPICALSFYTAIEDPTRFEAASDVGPYLGLTPKTSQSGKSRRSGRISRAGNRLTRSHLNMAAGVLLRSRTKDHPLRSWALKLAERSGRGKARTALARRLAVTLLAMWKSGKPFDPALAASRSHGIIPALSTANP